MAGRKRKPPEDMPPEDMLKMLQDVATGRRDATPLQVRAAIAAVQYTHTRTRDGGKKDEVEKRAQAVAAKFKTTPPPLKVVRS